MQGRPITLQSYYHSHITGMMIYIMILGNLCIPYDPNKTVTLQTQIWKGTTLFH